MGPADKYQSLIAIIDKRGHSQTALPLSCSNVLQTTG